MSGIVQGDQTCRPFDHYDHAEGGIPYLEPAVDVVGDSENVGRSDSLEDSRRACAYPISLRSSLDRPAQILVTFNVIWA